MENLRFKFRAWDGHEIFNVDVLAIGHCSWDCPDYGKRGISLAYQSFIKVMQYTGMKDKNEIPIYEGDLINGGGLLVPFELYWNTPSAEWYVKRGDDEGWKIDLSCSKRYEVVGNKFEDKHLLEGDAV